LVTIDRLAYGGNGVAHPRGFTVFVPRTAPGDQVDVEIRDVRRRYARAVPVRIHTPSILRQNPRCLYFESCGGCHYQHLDSSQHAPLKHQHVRETLERLGPGNIDVAPLIEPAQKWNYRNRLTYHRAENGHQGYVAWKEHEVIDIKDCPIGD